MLNSFGFFTIMLLTTEAQRSTEHEKFIKIGHHSQPSIATIPFFLVDIYLYSLNLSPLSTMGEGSYGVNLTFLSTCVIACYLQEDDDGHI